MKSNLESFTVDSQVKIFDFIIFGVNSSKPQNFVPSKWFFKDCGTDFSTKQELFDHAGKNHPKKGATPCPLHDTILWDRKTHQEHVYQHYALLKEERKKLNIEKKAKSKWTTVFCLKK